MRTLLLGASAGLLATGVLAGCDTLFLMGDDPYWLAQVCEDGSLDCFAQGTTTTSTPTECIPDAGNTDIANDCGAFVSPNGSDDDAVGKGTKAAPYLTLTKALSETTTGRVYACAKPDKPFDEAVSPKADVTIYGGLDCANEWTYDAAKKSVWTAAADAVPLTVTGAVKVEVYDFALTARDAVMAGGSSIVVLAAGEKAELSLERCDVVAGDGQDGVTPEKPAGTGTPGAPGKDGANGCLDATSKLGGDAGTNMCDSVSYNGGPGGNGTTADGAAGSDGQPQPGTPPNDGAAGAAQVGAASLLGLEAKVVTALPVSSVWVPQELAPSRPMGTAALLVKRASRPAPLGWVAGVGGARSSAPTGVPPAPVAAAVAPGVAVGSKAQGVVRAVLASAC